VDSVAFSPDGKFLATASYDKTARIWEVQRGQEIHNLPHDGTVNSVAFSPDGKFLATASDDKTARIWPVSAEDLIKEACRRVTMNLTAREWESILQESDCRTCPMEGQFNKSSDLFTSIKTNLKRAQLMISPSSAPGPMPGECQPCIAEAFCDRK
jgi:WD40 repeat protein